LPGQYYQAETGNSYNYFRDYSPQTGRYIEGDPVGLLGGSYSTYSYVGANPVSMTDVFGLAAHLVQLQYGVPSSQPLYDWAKSYQPSDFNTIVVHGSQDGQFSDTGPIAYSTISPANLAKALMETAGYDPKLPTQLVACSAGAAKTGAQALADALGADVLASPQVLRANPDFGKPPLGEVQLPQNFWDWLTSSHRITLTGNPTWITFTPHRP
jgi:RHS repeat-associated protein